MRFLIVFAFALVLAVSAGASVDFVHESGFTFEPFPPEINRLEFVDYNNDGQRELLAVCDTLVVLWDITGDSVIFRHATDTLRPHTQAVVGDVNRDTIPDLVLVVADPDTAFLSSVPVPTDWRIICFDGASGFADSTLAVQHTDAPWNALEYSQGMDFLCIIDLDNNDMSELMYSYRYLSYDQWSSFEGGYTRVFDYFPDSVRWTEPVMALDAMELARAGGVNTLAFRELRGSSLQISDESYTEVRLVECDSLGQLTPLSLPCVDTGCTGGGNGFRDCTLYDWSCGDILGSSQGDEIISLRGYSLFCPAPPVGQLTIELVLFADSSHNPNGTFDEIWSVSYMNQLTGLGNFMVHPNLPGYFFGIAGDTLFMFRGENGTIRYQTTDIPHGQRYWETNWPDSIPRLVVMNGNQVDIYSLDIATAVEDEYPTSLPHQFILGQPYPNPFNSKASIPVTIASPGTVRVEVFNLVGQSIAVIADRHFTVGEYRLQWDASTHASGIYLVRAVTREGSVTRKLMHLK